MIDFGSLAPTLVTVGAAVLVLPMLDPRSSLERALPCAVCLVLIGRTLAWRLTSTLPPFSFDLDTLWAYLFASIEALSTVSSMLLFFFLARTRDRRPEADRAQSWVTTHRPRIDLLIPTYDEDAAILERTIIGAQAQDYDNYRVYVLDDGKREWLRDLCRRRDVGYLVRTGNSHAKAGNINNAIEVLGHAIQPAEFIAVLDADFVAQPKFLSRAVSLFADASVGCVQTPQHFFNTDPLQHGFRASSHWPDEQRFFFDVLLASKDAWGAAFCCGTSSICRREALEAIGGVPTESVTEDMLLSLKLKAAGWKTVYLNERLSMGLAPEGVSEYITQRSRWCIGFMQIARGDWGPFGRARLPLIDRISLFDAFLYWGPSFPFRIMCLAAPVVYGLTGAAVIYADADGVLMHYGPSICAAVATLAWITSGRVLPIVTDAAQLLVAVDAMKAAVFGFLRPAGQKFRVTAKGRARDRVTVQGPIFFKVLLPLLVLTLSAIVYGTQYPFSPVYGDRSAPIWLFWAYYNMTVLLVTTLTCIELPRPKFEGFRADEAVTLMVGSAVYRARMLVLSDTGATLQGLPSIPVGAPCTVRLSTIEAPIPSRLIRTGKRTAEIAFEASPPIGEAIIRKLFSGPYQISPQHFRFTGVLAAIAGRIAS
ncbi:glycosyltransferase [Bradyrhizobium sp. ISRA443]|uniref:glycosyltransferase family 2 protein n=1 Tax=unclassified Bradyrhizobium TaxID=2631580 RepID=UPI002478C6DC|nr:MULTISPECIES: glycosyltransferase [unclassified Bradyrhizobium]WGR94614.1 glycosyltransferase [Bradyrhizobium sp. ISRA435]WGR99393.1 glycosyltransferase [Bradyrhizobium sp. ISRA436]WGS06284.1 glycosyltransferase [Bradyrhizobium sp. ISRA437]WGS13168.1 glycosyltransferase [Bradyrhizobium sp. ISRA443]